MSALEIVTHREDGRLRLSVSGDLDLESSPRLLSAIKDGLEGARSVEVGLTGVGYLDSSGVAVLIHGYKLAHRDGIEFVILDPSTQVMAVIELSQLQQFFTIRSSGASS